MEARIGPSCKNLYILPCVDLRGRLISWTNPVVAEYRSIISCTRCYFSTGTIICRACTYRMGIFFVCRLLIDVDDTSSGWKGKEVY